MTHSGLTLENLISISPSLCKCIDRNLKNKKNLARKPWMDMTPLRRVYAAILKALKHILFLGYMKFKQVGRVRLTRARESRKAESAYKDTYILSSNVVLISAAGFELEFFWNLSWIGWQWKIDYGRTHDIYLIKIGLNTFLVPQLIF